MELVLTDRQYEVFDDRSRYLMIMGSAGSGKTIFACTKVIMYALEYPNARVGVFRQTLPSLKKTAWKEIRELLLEYNIVFKENKSDGVITLDNDSTIEFIPTDSDEKLRSLNLDYVYVEQAEEISLDVFTELDLRIRHKVYKEHWGQFLLVVQPGRKTHWLYRLFYQLKDNDPDYHKEHFSYLDNPFLPEEQRKAYEALKDIDPDKYRTHTLGEWITDSKQIFTSNWSVGHPRFNFSFYTGGIDWGWNSPACFLLCGWYDDVCYVLGEVYRTEMTNSEFLERIKNLLAQHNLTYGDLDAVYCDAADPEKIEVFYQAGLNTYPSVKNVSAKISTTRETRIVIDESCENLIRELPEYQWKKNKNGDILDEPVKENDHAVDALCYNCYGVRGELTSYVPGGSFDLSEVHVY